MTRKPTKRQQDYWEQVLLTHRLGMGRGTSSKVDYKGTSKDVDDAYTKEIGEQSGRKKPEGKGPQ